MLEGAAPARRPRAGLGGGVGGRGGGLAHALAQRLTAEPEGATEATPRSTPTATRMFGERPPAPHNPRSPAWDSELGSLATGCL